MMDEPVAVDAGAATLVVQDLRFGYAPEAAVIDGLSGQLHGGRVCALIGPNAAGKSTLLRLLLGHLEPWSGRVQVNGLDIGSTTARQRAGVISYVPQRGGTNFAFTVEQVIAMGRFAAPSGDGTAAAVERAIEACDLAVLRRRVYAQLSAGQQQRVLVARALAQLDDGGSLAGRAMLMDEPVSAMDLWHVHHVMKLLRTWAQRGAAVLVVLHDLNLAARWADEVWLLHGGRLAAAGPWSQVLTPDVLEPVYRVQLETIGRPGGQRPLIFVADSDTLSR